MKAILLTLLLYALDTVIIGSIVGLIFVLGDELSNTFNNTCHNLFHSYLTGLMGYFIIDSILIKFREIYKYVEEQLNESNNQH